MTMSEKFCLSYDCFKWDFIVLKDDKNLIKSIYVMCGYTIFIT